MEHSEVPSPPSPSSPYLSPVSSSSSGKRKKKRTKHKQKTTSVQRDTITIFENTTARRFNGKVIFIPETMNELFQVANDKLGIVGVAAFKEDGLRINDVTAICPKDRIFISVTNHFVTPKKSEEAFGDNDWITLNVGGRIFHTTKSTLFRDKNCMLARLVSDEWESMRDAEGCFLIDRSPEHFAPVLHYLRTGVLILDDNVNAAGVLEEAKFYGVAGIEEQLIEQESRKGDLDSFSRRDIIGLLLTSSNLHLRSQGIDLAGVDLSRLDLSHINFRMSIFREANLAGANLDNARLQQADLKGANLAGATLRGANLGGANLEGATLRGANFEDRGQTLHSILEGANLKNADLEDCNLAGANLRAANMKGANLSGANLRGADLAGANLKDTNLKGANVANTNMRGANLLGVDYDIRTVSSR